MIILKIIFLILFAPFRMFSNASTPKNSLIDIKLTYSTLCYIETKPSINNFSDKVLITTYLLYLGRYFYICDERQLQPISEFLLHQAKSTELKASEFTSAIYHQAYSTLNSNEQNAVRHLFFMGIPPITFTEEEAPKNKTAEYTIRVSQDNKFYFLMSSGPDIILLPLTVGILYEYTMEKLKNKHNKEEFNSLIRLLINSYKDVSPRTMEGQYYLPLKIISQSNIK